MYFFFGLKERGIQLMAGGYVKLNIIVTGDLTQSDMIL